MIGFLRSRRTSTVRLVTPPFSFISGPKGERLFYPCAVPLPFGHLREVEELMYVYIALIRTGASVDSQCPPCLIWGVLIAQGGSGQRGSTRSQGFAR